ncbi:MAG: acetyl-CoA synthetase [Haloferacaceae archaeon]
MTADRPLPARDARVLGDLVARERRAARPAIRSYTGARERTVSYRDCVTTAAKAGNLLRHLGVRGGDAVDGTGEVGAGTGGRSPRLVAIAPDPVPEPILAFLGAATVGGVARFDPRATDARALVVSAADEDRYEPSPGTNVVVYGGEPADPGTAHWESDVWSENPAVPPAGVDPPDPVLGADRTYTHAELLAAARTAVDRLDVAPGDAIAVRASLADPRAVVAGVLAPLLAGGVVVLPDDEPRAGAGVGEGPEPRTAVLDDVSL